MFNHGYLRSAFALRSLPTQKNPKIMAKINSIVIGKGRGSIGNVTLRTLKGQTVASQKVDAKAGKLGTFNQVFRRVHWANLVNAYKALNGLDSKSMSIAFPNRDPKETSYNAFMRKNVAISDVFAVFLDKATAEKGYVCPAPFMFSEGDLVAPAALQATYEDGEFTLTGASSLSNMGAVSQILINTFKCEDGDTLTLVAMAWSDAQGAKFFERQIHVDSQSTESLPSWITSAGVISMGVPSAMQENSEGIAVRGRNDNGVYRISSAQFGSSMTTANPYLRWTSASNKLDVMKSYGYREEPYLQANPL